MYTLSDLKEHLDKLATTINETCDNARNALNLLMGVSVVMGSLILGVDDEILFLDQGTTVSYAGIPITVSTVFAIFPIAYVVIYALLALKLISIAGLVKRFRSTQDLLMQETQSGFLHPITHEQDKLIKDIPNSCNARLKSFFFLDALMHKDSASIIMTFILLYCVPLSILIGAMITFLPYQSWLISGSHWFIIMSFAIMIIRMIKKFVSHPKRYILSAVSFYVPWLTCVCSLLALYDRMDNGGLDFWYIGDVYDKASYPRTALDLGNKTLVEKPTPDAILAVAQQQDFADKQKKRDDKIESHFEKAKWQYAEGYFLRNRSFKGINLSHAIAYKIDLQGSDLRNSNLGLSNLQNANLYNSNLQSTNLYNSNLQNANLDYANLQNTNLDDANLQSADLLGSNLQNAFLSYANLQNANLASVNLQDAFLSHANLQNTNLDDANLQSAALLSSDLQNAKLKNANLQKANLFEANLENVTLMGASLQSADLSLAKLKNIILVGTNLHNAYLIDITLKDAVYSSKYFNNIEKTDLGKYTAYNSQMLDICSDVIKNKKWNKRLTQNYSYKRKKVGNGYDYSAYCSDKP